MFDWDDYPALAKRLARSQDQAAQRTAISRAYYAAYHAVSVYVRAQNLVPPSQDLSHMLAWRILKQDADIERVDVGIRGDDLKRVRHSADYKSPYPGDLAKDMRYAISEAEALIEDIAKLP